MWEALRHGWEVSTNFKLLAHVINIHAHDKNVLVSARLCGNHQIIICELTGVDALNPRLLLSLITVVNLFGTISFFHAAVGLHGHVFRHVRLWIYGTSHHTGVPRFLDFTWWGTTGASSRRSKMLGRNGQTKKARQRFRRICWCSPDCQRRPELQRVLEGVRICLQLPTITGHSALMFDQSPNEKLLVRCLRWRSQSGKVDGKGLCVDFSLVQWSECHGGRLSVVTPEREARVGLTDTVDLGDHICGTRLRAWGSRKNAISSCAMIRRSTSPFLLSQLRWWGYTAPWHWNSIWSSPHMHIYIFALRPRFARCAVHLVVAHGLLSRLRMVLDMKNFVNMHVWCAGSFSKRSYCSFLQYLPPRLCCWCLAWTDVDTGQISAHYLSLSSSLSPSLSASFIDGLGSQHFFANCWSS